MRHKWLKRGGIVGFFTLLALIALHQPITHTATHMTGEFVTDYYHFHWNYWWIRHAITHGFSIYETNFIFFPFTSSLAYHTLTPFWYPLWALIEPFAGTFAAFNVIYFVAITLTGVSLYALLRQFGVVMGWSLIFGAIFALSSLMFDAIYWSMTSLIAWFWLPLALLLWHKISQARRAKDQLGLSIALGLTLCAMILTDLQYPFFLAFILIPYGLWTLWHSPTRLRLIVFGLLSIMLALGLLWAFGTIPAILAFEHVGLSPTPADRAVSIDFPQGFLGRTESGISFGLVIIPLWLISIGLWVLNRRKIRGAFFWLLLTLPPLILSAGAFITLGETQLTLPYAILHNVMGGMFRYPERFSVVFIMAVAIFSGKVLTSIPFKNASIRHAVMFALLIAVLANSRLFHSIAIQPQPQRYEIYETMGREPYQYVVLEVPTGGSSGEGIVGIPEYSALQFYGTIHGKQMFNGHLSRVDVNHYWWTRTDDALMAWLGQRQLIDIETVTAQLRDRIYNYPIGYLVIHTDLIEPYGSTLNEVVGYLNSVGDLLCPPITEADLIVYRTRWHPDGCSARIPPQIDENVYQIDIGGEDTPYIGWGVHNRENIFDISLRWLGQYPQTNLYLDLPPNTYEITVEAQAFAEPRTLTALINGVQLGDTVTISPDGFNTYTLTTHAQVSDGESITLTLLYDTPTPVSSGVDARQLSIALNWIRFSQSN